MTVDDNNQIYIVATVNNKIVILNEEGTLNYEFVSVTGKTFNNPGYIISDNHGKFYVTDSGNNRVVVLFDPTAWTRPGTAILGSLTLDQDLTLENGYNLKIQPMDDVTSGSVVQSDGKLTINNKILTLNSGSSLEAVALNLSNSSLVLNQDMTFNIPITIDNTDNNIIIGNHTVNKLGTMSGPGKLIKKGDGTLIVNDTSTFGRGIDITEGSINLSNGVIIDADVQVASGGILKGTGSLLATLINEGIVAPGASPGIIDVQGNYVQSPGASLNIFISPAANPVAGINNSKLNITGAADIDGSLEIHAGDGDYIDGARYNILTALGGINGEFDNFSSNIPHMYSSKLSYDANNVFLKLFKNNLPEVEDINYGLDNEKI